MDRNWAERLAERRASLTRRELDIIEFITTHPNEAATLTQSQLCERAGVSKPLVISCFRSLGYGEYREFRQGIRGFYLGHMDSAQASAVALKDIADVGQLIDAALEVEASTVAALKRELRSADVEGLASAIWQAQGVYIYAEGTGFEPAHYLALRLRRCGIKAMLVGDDRMHALDDIAPLGRGDLCLTFCYTQNVTVILELFELIKQRGGRTAVVTGSPDPDLYRLSEFHIFVPRGQWNFKNSLAGPMIFAHLLLLAVELLGGGKLQDRLQRLEAHRKDFDSKTKEDTL